MNFFEAQDDARRRTKWLVLYFILAIIGVILSVYGVSTLVLLYTGAASGFWMPGVFLVVAFGTGGVMGMGSLFKTMQLNGGGAVVARDMGARQVDSHTTDTDERRLVNVVEEMAIASGVPVPEIWLMDDELGINAFAAGTEPGNAVVAVTRGCLQRLSRAELQGVVAHEFSHILNGDMRLNMRLMGLLFGILMISMIGRVLFHSLRFINVRSSRDDKGGGAGIMIAIVLAGVGLMIVGSVGVFFGRMIQAAISRQREYLADASAVQFTRHPDGIAGALKKIGGQEYGSKMNAAKASEASHLFFADGGMFSFGMATHPPLDVRIKAIQKSWNGEFITTNLPEVAAGRVGGTEGADPRASGFSGATSQSVPPPLPQQRIDHLGEPSEVDHAVGLRLLRGLDDTWLQACHDREEAQSLIFGLLLAEDNQLRSEEVMFVKKGAGPDAGELALRWNARLGNLHSSVKIALVDLAIPTLRRLTLPEYERFIEITQWLIASDGQVDLFEFMLQHMVQRHLDTQFYRKAYTKIKYRKLRSLIYETRVILSNMTAIGGKEQREEAFATAIEESGMVIEPLEGETANLTALEESLAKFNAATPLVKKQLIRMCGRAVMHDGVLESREAELLRATADAIGCSVPPFASS
ncbi:MAG: M48 family metallopeptidase [Akkermansiaceae bacterium]